MISLIRRSPGHDFAKRWFTPTRRALPYTPMPVTEEQIKEALKQVRYPGFSRDIVSFGLVKEIRIDDGAVTVQMALATNEPAIPQAIKTESEAALARVGGIRSAKVL